MVNNIVNPSDKQGKTLAEAVKKRKAETEAIKKVGLPISTWSLILRDTSFSIKPNG